ncbi:hypothetical protein NON00_11210 [Roseomonas sp. GC11]|uniref:hypothetical protein n=1 Tax=Roseomonas sp. GC11 TaxID=2950546 RepID=UPI00210AD5F3|nr:hypothetical protein [Roseomonas sp. GC11]MCQ4160497.1 hypothetical protein [Roseomonas sp. GC11]
MARIPLTLAAATLALTAGVAQAQMAAPMAPPRAADSAATYGMPGMAPGATPVITPPAAPAPAQPFANVTLPPQQGVGDGAYNGGGVVLEYLPDGTTRVVQ